MEQQQQGLLGRAARSDNGRWFCRKPRVHQSGAWGTGGVGRGCGGETLEEENPGVWRRGGGGTGGEEGRGRGRGGREGEEEEEDEEEEERREDRVPVTNPPEHRQGVGGRGREGRGGAGALGGVVGSGGVAETGVREQDVGPGGEREVGDRVVERGPGQIEVRIRGRRDDLITLTVSAPGRKLYSHPDGSDRQCGFFMNGHDRSDLIGREATPASSPAYSRTQTHTLLYLFVLLQHNGSHSFSPTTDYCCSSGSTAARLYPGVYDSRRERVRSGDKEPACKLSRWICELLSRQRFRRGGDSGQIGGEMRRRYLDEGD
ncbi:unnamed protein product [Pleuronectes platessa]|uniref:Uncharacterized protein n=1 Tax=Pleuronectes platessa TaxID=8262 RepID=A0A9N7YCD4_PLEPL|nr:unnamed protein product [Pleuronectes platessa]